MIDNPGLTSDENDSDYVLNSQRNEDQTKQIDFKLNSQIMKMSFLQQPQFDNFETVLLNKTSQNQQNFHNLTPQALRYDSANFNINSQNQVFRIQNKENYPSNLYVNSSNNNKSFSKKISLHDICLSSGRKFGQSQAALSNQSKKFIYNSIQKVLKEKSFNSQKDQSLSNSSSTSNNESVNFQDNRLMFEILGNREEFNKIHSNCSLKSPQTDSMNIPNTFSNSGQLGQESKNQNDVSSVPSFDNNQQVIDYFLTEEEQLNDLNDSEQGIQVLSELKSQLTSIMNGSQSKSLLSNQEKSKNTVISNEGMTVNSKRASQLESNRNLNICEQVAQKLKQLKTNILVLQQKVNQSPQCSQYEVKSWKKQAQILQNFENDGNKKQVFVKKQPQIFFKSESEFKPLKKLIYPDSKIIFSRNDDEFVEFNEQFSKIMSQPDENIHIVNETSSKKSNGSNIQQNSQSMKNEYETKQSRIHIQEDSNREDKTEQFFSESKNIDENDLTDFQKFSEVSKFSNYKMGIQKSSYKLSFKKMFGTETQPDKDSINESNFSSVANQTNLAQQSNGIFTGRFNKILN